MPTPISESVLEQHFIGQLENMKYAYRGDIRDRASLHASSNERSVLDPLRLRRRSRSSGKSLASRRLKLRATERLGSPP
jgi:hypothetical protein